MNRCFVGLIALLVSPVWLSACDGDGDDDRPQSTTWQTAFDATDLGWLMSVWGPSADLLYTVGGSPEEGLIMRYDGASWSEVDPGVAVPLLNWVHGFGADDVTIAGSQGTVLHWDGAAWTLQPTPTQQNLWGVWGASPDDLWAVGGEGRSDGDATILRYDGSSWREIPVPTTQKAGVRAFFKVWGSAADNVYIVGQNGVVLRWNGTELVEELVGASDDLIALWGTASGKVVIVGGRGNGIVTTWDGSQWRTETPTWGDQGIPLPGLNGVWLRKDGTAHVVGGFGTVATLELATMEAVVAPIDTPLDFHATYGVGGVLTAVGGSLRAVAGPYQGLAWTRGLDDVE